ncbi:MAG: amidase [Alphaproteobacteria bacterium]|nr:amidase [Alphaproteobacteria bacterium]
MSDLLALSATDAARLIRQKKLSPVEYVKTIVEAVQRSQSVLNAFTVVTAEAALEQARIAEGAVMARTALGPLHGIPVSIKDLVDTAGIETFYGSAVHKGHVPTKDATTVQRLKEAGGILIGKTTTPEYGHKGLTDGPSFGVTRNPWNLEYSPGGSSGGAAAHVAAGLGPLALGTDGAGSIRLPASASGIVGLKPTRGAVAHGYAPDVISSISYSGPMTRTVADAALMFDVLAGPEPDDPWSLGGLLAPVSAGLMGNRIAGVKIGYIPRMANPDVDNEVKAATEAALETLADLGAEVEEVTDKIDWIEEDGRILMRTGMWTKSRHDLERWGNQLDSSYRDFLEDGRKVSMERLREAESARTRLYQAVQRLFGRYDLLASPSLVVPALKASHHASRDQVIVNGKPQGFTRTGFSSYLYAFNLTGHPAISIPNGWNAAGLPIGFQVIGRWWADRDLLRIAAMLEVARPWSQRRPPHWGGVK